MSVVWLVAEDSHGDGSDGYRTIVAASLILRSSAGEATVSLLQSVQAICGGMLTPSLTVRARLGKLWLSRAPFRALR